MGGYGLETEERQNIPGSFKPRCICKATCFTMNSTLGKWYRSRSIWARYMEISHFKKILDLLALNPGTKVGMDSELSVEHRYYLRSQSKRAPHGICQLQ